MAALITNEPLQIFEGKKGPGSLYFPGCMGSHGGATAGEPAGEIIRIPYGVTEEYVGCPILSSMENGGGETARQQASVLWTRNAFSKADDVLCGRIKAPRPSAAPAASLMCVRHGASQHRSQNRFYSQASIIWKTYWSGQVV